MAKRKTSRRRRRKIQLTPFQTVVFTLVGLCLALGLYVSVGSGVGTAPTWDEIYAAVGLAEPLPADDLPENTDAVHFIDVGQADATLLQSGGEYCLVDAGDTDSEQKLMAYLEERGVTHLKLLVMSHPHADHIGSMAAVLEKIEVEQVLLPDFDKAPYPTTRLFEKVMDAIEASGAVVTTAAPGQSFSVGSGSLQVLAAGVETDNYNDLSRCFCSRAASSRCCSAATAKSRWSRRRWRRGRTAGGRVQGGPPRVRHLQHDGIPAGHPAPICGHQLRVGQQLRASSRRADGAV